MATASGKDHLALTAMLLVSVFVSGCNALMPIEPQASDPGSAETAEKNSRHVLTPADNALLPRQTYDSAGQRVPYVPQPNPYTTAAAPVPAEAKSTFMVASYLLKEGNLDRARARFTELTEKFPALAGPWVNLGVIAEKDGRLDEAIEHYQKAISVNKNNVNAYIALGLAQRRQGYFGDAHKTYLAALDVWKDFPEAHLNLAILYDLYVNKPEEAQKHYEAYYFLTGERDEKVHKWLVEVKRRTGIERSFIDTPPKEIAEAPIKTVDDSDASADAGSSG